MIVKKAGVIGAGIMGKGVSQVVAQAGIQVVLLDISEDILKNAKREIEEAIRLQILLKTTGNFETSEKVLRRIMFSTDYKEVRDVDLVVENVTEKWAIKKEVYTKLEKICPKHCVFASNTSAIPITRLASVTKRDSKVIGMHFMNPVSFKQMVEVIRTKETSDETVSFIKRFLTQIGKECVLVNDSPGFVSNRILMLTINEAVHLLQEKVASTRDIDRIFKMCFDHKMGPLETADLIGLDTVLNSIEVLYESFKDNKFKPCPLLEKMVKKGLYGCKNGKGFYEYPVNHPSKLRKGD